MRTTTSSIWIVLAASSGCLSDADPGADAGVHALQTALGTEGDSGAALTALSATGHAGEPECLDGEVAVTSVSGVLTTTCSVDSAVMTVVVDGDAASSLGAIEADAFREGDGMELADYAFELTLANGEHTVLVCFTPSGAEVFEPEHTCAPLLTVNVSCEPSEENACELEGVFGNLVGNPNLCHGGGTPHLPVHLRGAFGDSVVLHVSGPNGFSFDATMRRAGDGCIYHYNWDTRDGNHGGPGSYTFDFTNDAGDDYAFTRDLSCSP